MRYRFCLLGTSGSHWKILCSIHLQIHDLKQFGLLDKFVVHWSSDFGLGRDRDAYLHHLYDQCRQ